MGPVCRESTLLVPLPDSGQIAWYADDFFVVSQYEILKVWCILAMELWWVFHRIYVDYMNLDVRCRERW